MRNAVSMAAQAHFTPKQLHGKHSGNMIGMLKEKGVLFDQYPGWFRYGTVCKRMGFEDAPIFSKNREYLKGFLTVEEE
jgi:hypothetical protein